MFRTRTRAVLAASLLVAAVAVVPGSPASAAPASFNFNCDSPPPTVNVGNSETVTITITGNGCGGGVEFAGGSGGVCCPAGTATADGSPLLAGLPYTPGANEEVIFTAPATGTGYDLFKFYVTGQSTEPDYVVQLNYGPSQTPPTTTVPNTPVAPAFTG